jgi:type II restriction enzyme
LKYTKAFETKIGCRDTNEVFAYLIATLKATVSGWDYFVNWAKVFGNVADLEIDLNTLNYLIGKENIEKEFVRLLEKHPSIARVIPILIACRQAQFDILDRNDGEAIYKHYDFRPTANMPISKVVEFAKDSGFLEKIKDKKIKSIVDYVIGIEVGLDSNGRKNRGGTSMERLVESHVAQACNKCGGNYISQATSSEIRSKFDIEVKVDKTNRRIDFAIKRGKRLFLIETNFYTGSGSKLKSTAGEYKNLSDFFKSDGHKFIWITDGAGWRSTQRPLRETFEHIDNLLNLEMVSKGLLEDILCEA